MTIALLIIDMQKTFIHDTPAFPQVERAVKHINYTAELLRDSGHLVVHIRDVEDAPYVPADRLDIIDEIVQKDGDLHVTKEWSNAFWHTNLEELLAEHKVEFIIAAGYAAEQCVTFTYNGAIERGFKIAILQNGILSPTPDGAATVSRDRNLISYPVLQYLAGTGRAE